MVKTQSDWNTYSFLSFHWKLCKQSVDRGSLLQSDDFSFLKIFLFNVAFTYIKTMTNYCWKQFWIRQSLMLSLCWRHKYWACCLKRFLVTRCVVPVMNLHAVFLSSSIFTNIWSSFLELTEDLYIWFLLLRRVERHLYDLATFGIVRLGWQFWSRAKAIKVQKVFKFPFKTFY